MKTIKAASLLAKDRRDINTNFSGFTPFEGLTVTAAEVNQFDGMVVGLDTTATPATGTCAVQFELQDANGVAVSEIMSGIGYISSAVGALGSAITSVATLTNGSILTIITGRLFHWVTSDAGLLGVTLTGTAGTYYVTLVLPSGKVVTSTACVVE